MNRKTTKDTPTSPQTLGLGERGTSATSTGSFSKSSGASFGSPPDFNQTHNWHDGQTPNNFPIMSVTPLKMSDGDPTGSARLQAFQALQETIMPAHDPADASQSALHLKSAQWKHVYPLHGRQPAHASSHPEGDVSRRYPIST